MNNNLCYLLSINWEENITSNIKLDEIESIECSETYDDVKKQWEQLNGAYSERLRKITEELRLQKFDDATR